MYSKIQEQFENSSIQLDTVSDQLLLYTTICLQLFNVFYL